MKENIAENNQKVINNTYKKIKRTRVGIISGVSVTLALIIVISSIMNQYALRGKVSATYLEKEVSYSKPISLTHTSSYVVPEIPAIPATPAIYQTVADEYTILNGTAEVGVDVIIPDGTYTLKCISGEGNVFAHGTYGTLKLNEIMAPYDDGFYISTYNNFKLKQGMIFETDCELRLIGKPKDVLVQAEIPSIPTIPAKTVTEKLIVSYNDDEKPLGGEVCYSAASVVPCTSLVNYATLKQDIESKGIKTMEEYVVKQYGEYEKICFKNSNVIRCGSIDDSVDKKLDKKLNDEIGTRVKETYHILDKDNDEIMCLVDGEETDCSKLILLDLLKSEINITRTKEAQEEVIK